MEHDVWTDSVAGIAQLVEPSDRFRGGHSSPGRASDRFKGGVSTVGRASGRFRVGVSSVVEHGTDLGVD